jgi:deoxycytidylate deaminase
MKAQTEFDFIKNILPTKLDMIKCGVKDLTKWEKHAMRLAWQARRTSQDPYVKTGACALRKKDNSVAAVGYNGPPPKVEIDWSDREKRRGRVVHAEKNCLKYLMPDECEIMAVTLMPCSNCLIDMRASGIMKVIFAGVFINNTNQHVTYGSPESVLDLAEEFGMTMRYVTDFEKDAE